MFDIGWSELVLVGLIALIVIGPKELPTVLRTAGQWMGKVKRMASEFQGQFQEALREAEISDLKQQADDLTGELKSITDYDPLADVDNDGTHASEQDEPADGTPEHEATAETTSEAGEAVSPDGDGTKPVATETAAAIEQAESAPVAAVESAPVEPAEDLTPAETPPPKQAGGTA